MSICPTKQCLLQDHILHQTLHLQGNFWFIDLDGGHEVQPVPRRQKRGYVQKRLDLLDRIIQQLADATVMQQQV